MDNRDLSLIRTSLIRTLVIDAVLEVVGIGVVSKSICGTLCLSGSLC